MTLFIFTNCRHARQSKSILRTYLAKESDVKHLGLIVTLRHNFVELNSNLYGNRTIQDNVKKLIEIKIFMKQ